MTFPLLPLLIAALSVGLLSSCKQSPDASAPSASSGSNSLSCKINGTEWSADSDIFGAFHPKGYNKAIMIAGDKGSGDNEEQTFNINLYNTSGPGTYHIKSGNPDLSVAQFMDGLKPDTPMYGGQMDFDLTVIVTKASSSPAVVEATFSGTLTGNPGDVLTITEGKFTYHE